MCKYCKKVPGVGWALQMKFVNTEEEFRTINKQRIWSTHNKRNRTFATIRNFSGITPDYEDADNGMLKIEIPDIEENVSISINYCPFCGMKLGDAEEKYI